MPRRASEVATPFEGGPEAAMSGVTPSFEPVTLLEPLTGPCGLCGGTDGTRAARALVCADCGWRYGDVPDYDLPRPRVDVVYYVRSGETVKIGTSRNPRQRLRALWFDELLAFERGARALEQARHAQFAALRRSGEWFEYRDALADHVGELRCAGAPWQSYARWVSERAS